MPRTTDILVLDTQVFFSDLLQEAFRARQVHSFSLAGGYICDLLKFFVGTDHLYPIVDKEGKKKQETLAEMFLKAHQTQDPTKQIKLKRLADLSLYLCGFFGDSFKRRTTGIDYCASMGMSAYGSLARLSRDPALPGVFSELESNFIAYIDVLSWISQKSFTAQERASLIDQQESIIKPFLKEDISET